MAGLLVAVRREAELDHAALEGEAGGDARSLVERHLVSHARSLAALVVLDEPNAVLESDGVLGEGTCALLGDVPRASHAAVLGKLPAQGVAAGLARNHALGAVHATDDTGGE
eukprot:4488909-Prymnesium_polylepis.1